MYTPCFPAFRSRLAALGRRTTQNLRQTTLVQLQQHLRDFLPAPLLASEEDGPNSRDRVFSLRLTFECFGNGSVLETGQFLILAYLMPSLSFFRRRYKRWFI